MRVRLWATAIGLVMAPSGFVATPAGAQGRGLASVEVVTGHAGYVDEAWDHRVMAGGAVKIALTPRFTIGPEVVYLHGRHGSHEVTVTGTGTWDLVRPAVRRRIVPFVVFGAGLVRQTSLVGRGPGTTGLVPYSTQEATVSGGIGARFLIGRGLFIAPDLRLGWAPESRLTVTVGWRR